MITLEQIQALSQQIAIDDEIYIVTVTKGKFYLCGKLIVNVF